MKVAMISDIHVDVNRDYDIVGALVSSLAKKKANLLLLAGDISSNAEKTLETVCSIEEKSKVQVLFVAGNHDLWSDDFGKNPTDEIYARLCADTHCLSNHPLVLKDTVIIGDVGWYDYSFGSARFSKEEFSLMERNGRVWQDFLKNQWTRDNLETSDFFLKRLEKQMQSHADKKFFVVSHMVPVPELRVVNSQGDWDYFNAFLGSIALGDLYRRYPVRHALFGHVHYRRSFEASSIGWHCRCLNYHNEWRLEDGSTCEQQVDNAMECIDIT
jgi:putative phosphoesterase